MTMLDASRLGNFSMPARPQNSRETAGGPSADGGGSGEPARARQAWLREMERAQLTGWFQPFSAGAASDLVPPLHGQGTVSADLRRWPGADASAHERFAGAPSSVSTRLALRSESIARPEPRPSPFMEVDRVGRASPMPSDPVEAPHQSESPMGSGGVEQGPAPTVPIHAVASLSDGRYPNSIASEGGQHPSVPIAMPAEAGRSAAAVSWHVPASQAAWLPTLDLALKPGTPIESPEVSGAEASFMRASSPAQAHDESADPVSRTAAGRIAGGLRDSSTGVETGTRVHAQWMDAGLNLWLGMDGTAQQVGLQAYAVVQSLQRTLREQGQRLSRVVCNGRVVFDAAQPSSTALRGGNPFEDVLARQAAGQRFPHLFSLSSRSEIS
ncbi:hypothetical protein [Paracidovorax anthurii]|uniref:Uncharacterized protein n=1 Tax=Paracidovorax anthurii TaxID=78229 RepID=A0A328YRZ2_9BURK|nr:hypothetical protein [Paracidovorax anthurii]RAR75903.1 hypothetical protein AX018_106017 [Paracidovorax anthurii]